MDIRQAERNIKIAWLFSIIAIPAQFVSRSLGPLYLFLPWLFPGNLQIPELAIVSVLAFMVYRKSRVAALLLLVIFILDRGFTFIWLYAFDTVFIIIWLCITLVWSLLLIQGIRGTFAYHRLKGTMTDESLLQTP